MMFRTIQMLILGLMCYRWMRYVFGAFFLLFALPITVSAFEQTNIVQHSGVATRVGYVQNANTGAYLYSHLMLIGGDTRYIFHRNEFTPALPEEQLSEAPVTLWVVEGPLVGNDSVVAIQLIDDQGNSVKYVTDNYLHPADHRNRDLVPGAILLALALGFIGAGAFAPTAPQPARRQAVVAGGSSSSPME